MRGRCLRTARSRRTARSPDREAARRNVRHRPVRPSRRESSTRPSPSCDARAGGSREPRATCRSCSVFALGERHRRAESRPAVLRSPTGSSNALGLERPTLLVFEDVHWADGAPARAAGAPCPMHLRDSPLSSLIALTRPELLDQPARIHSSGLSYRRRRSCSTRSPPSTLPELAAARIIGQVTDRLPSTSSAWSRSRGGEPALPRGARGVGRRELGDEAALSR